jgi:hypothetical protein
VQEAGSDPLPGYAVGQSGSAVRVGSQDRRANVTISACGPTKAPDRLPLPTGGTRGQLSGIAVFLRVPIHAVCVLADVLTGLDHVIARSLAILAEKRLSRGVVASGEVEATSDWWLQRELA